MSLQHIYSAIDTPWNLSILVIHWHQSLSTLNNIYKYLGDLLCRVVSARLPRDLVSARDTRALTNFVTDSIWRNVNKQLEAAREMESLRTQLHCLIVVTTLADGSFVTYLSHWHLISTHQRLKSYLNTVTMLHANPIDAAICAAGPFYSHYLWQLTVSPLSHSMSLDTNGPDNQTFYNHLLPLLSPLTSWPGLTLSPTLRY